MLYDLLFPQFKGHAWTHVNLNEIAMEHAATIQEQDVVADDHWVNLLHQMLGVDHSWGGWLESRHHLMRNQYHKNVGPDHFWHLGDDFNVPVNTEVHLPVDAELVHAEMDPDQDGGWGGKLIFKYKVYSNADIQGWFILGHLDGIVKELRSYKAGDIIAKVGDRSVNGNWFPHLHVQCMKKLDLKVDGYSHWYDGIEHDFPDPSILLGVP